MRPVPMPVPSAGGRRPLLLAALAAGLAVAAVVALVTGGSGPARGTSDTGGAAVDPGSPAVRLLLHEHAAALLARDRAAYTAGLDDAPVSAAFRATQLAAFDHTDGVPFAAFDLDYDRTVVDAAPVAAVRTRLGDASAGIVRAELTYAYDGVDARPAQHTVYLTVVRRDGAWKLAGDTDLASAGGTSWRGPWDFGPLVVARGSSGLVLAHPASEAAPDVARAQALVQAVAADVDAGVAAVTAVWGTAWPGRVAIVVAASQPELDAAAGGGHPLDGVAAVAVAEPTTAVTPGPDVAAGQRIVMSGPALAATSATGRLVLVRHELTHLATRSVTIEGMPTWVVEGFADYVGNLAGAQPPRTVAAELAAAVAAAGAPVALPTDAAFVPAGAATDEGAGGDAGAAGSGTGAGGAAAAYEQAWYALRTVAELGGPAAPAAFYRAVAAAIATGATTTAAVDTALRQVAGSDTAAFTARWRALIVTELAS